MAEKIFENVTQFCYVGEGKGFPGVAQSAWDNLSIPPGKLYRAMVGEAVDYHLLNQPRAVVSFRGPKADVEKELAALQARGAVAPVVLSEKDGVIEGTIGALRYVLEDATEKHKNAASTLLADPNLTKALSTAEADNRKLRERVAALEEENTRLKGAAAKRIPRGE